MTLLGLARSPRCRWLVALLQLGLCGCANREPTGPLTLPPAPPFSASGDAPMPDRWWTTFEDTGLNRQTARAFDGSFTLAAALQRLLAARALARRQAADLWPEVNGIADAASDFSTIGPTVPLFGLGVSAAYQVDLWGRIESQVEAERLRAAATHADYHAAALTLSGEVARTWFSLIEARAQLALLDEQLETNRQGLALLEAGFGLGQTRGADVLRQRQLVESTREQAVIEQSRVDVLTHMLAVLQGRPPQAASYETGSELPPLPPLPATGLPSELVNRRPDVRRDFLAFQAADRDLAAAITAQYPRLNLTASVATTAESPEDLFRDWFVSIGSQLVAPLIDGGERRAEVNRTNAVLLELFNAYGQTVLVAFREVEDNLARERYQRERLERLNTQVELARQASLQLREQYVAQEADYLAVLSSITEAQRLQREILSARLDLVLYRVELYLALAGGFAPNATSLLEPQSPAAPLPLPDPQSLPAPQLIPTPPPLPEPQPLLDPQPLPSPQPAGDDRPLENVIDE